MILTRECEWIRWYSEILHNEPPNNTFVFLQHRVDATIKVEEDVELPDEDDDEDDEDDDDEDDDEDES